MPFWKRDGTEPAFSTAPRTGRRLLYVLFGAVILTGVVIVAWPDGLGVDLEVVTRGPMQVEVSEDGRTRVRDRYVVSAPVTATLLRVPLDAGDAVATGDPLIEFVPASAPLPDPRSQAQARARVTAAQAAVERARALREQAIAALAIAKDGTRRQRILLEQTSGTPSALERAELQERMREQELRSADFGVQISDQELVMARMATRPGQADGRSTTVPSPVDGQVLRVLNEGGGLVQAGTPIMEIGNPAALEVVIDVLTGDATRVKVGCRVVLERWGGAPLQGSVRRVEPSAFTRISALGVEEQRVNVIVDLDDAPEQWSTLGDGYRVEARIEVWSTPEALQVPVSAVFRLGQDWAVFVNEGGRATLRTVELGEWGAQVVEVRGGLEEGEEVVAYPSDAIDEGVLIHGGEERGRP